MQTLKIGWIGLGNMGDPMARRLKQAGYPLTVYNRSKEKETPLKEEGVNTADTPAQLLLASDLVFLMVSDDQAIRELFTGKDGLLSVPVSRKLIINMSTVSPGINKEFAKRFRQNENEYIDAPVSGSVKQAQEGQLVIMAGGDPSSIEKARPVLDRLGRLVLRVGDIGAGNMAKLAINALLAVQAQGLAEAVIFAEQHDIQPADFLTLFNNSAMGNIFGKIKGEAILHERYTAAFALKHIAKDLRLAGQEGLSTPLVKATCQSFQEAEQRLGNEDIIAIIKHLRPAST